ncbi:MAG: hypothetical protein JO069_10915 [Verrucomicrobia bacterium]|nr:hypothetical protein [Verrucomicrobiota bacterium]
MTLPTSRPPADPSTPAFIVGVTGHTDLDPAYRDRIKTEVKRIIRWLGKSSNLHDPALGPGLGLTRTPLILLSSLAPGADQWAVEAAREVNHTAGLRILAPLPFLRDQYLKASSFTRDGALLDEAASRFLAEFPDQDAFVVRLPEEVDLDDDALREKHRSILTGTAGKRERDRRYAAAGEYVAAYSNLLIALTDKPLGEIESGTWVPSESPGARAIAELKRRGVTAGLLPVLRALSGADAGPVIHIYAPRKSKPPLGGSAGRLSDTGEWLEVLYPYDCRPAGIREQEYNDPRWVEAGSEILKVTTQHLERLNNENASDPTREGRAFAEMLPGALNSLAETPRCDALRTANESLKTTLDRLARLRRRVADYSTQYNARLSRLKRTLFGLAFGVAFFFSLAENWEVPAPALPLQRVSFLAALGLTLATWLTYFRFKTTAAAERYDDYRAVAEGLRVQFYWTACGSGESVASHYLQRQRGELGWIRNVISAVAFPYELDRVHFNRLPSAAQRAVLQGIRTGWLDGQCAYLKRQIEWLTRRKELFSTYARILLWTGFALQVVLLCVAQYPAALVLPRALALLPLALAAVSLGALCLRRTRFEPYAKGSASDHGVPQIRSLPESRLITNALQVAALSLFTVGTVYVLGGIVPWLPPARNLGSIFKNLALAGGVLCGAWVEVNFFEENLRRYASMASLFQAACLRFNDYFSLPARVHPDQKAAAERQALANLQALLVAVGSEALSENAEWLITHRTRPLEPVSA